MNPSNQQPNLAPTTPQAPAGQTPYVPSPGVQAPLQPAAHTPGSDNNKDKNPKGNPTSTQNMLQIAEIRDGIVIMNDGSFRSVVMLKSINFDLMSPQEREGVESGYQAFLNSLYFPIQIFVRSQKVDIRPYLEKLDKIRAEHDNMLLSLLMQDYITFVANLATQTNIMDKTFYVVVPFFAKADVQRAITQSKNFFSGLTHIFGKNSQEHVVVNEKDLEDAKVELRNRIQAVLGGLQQCGVQGVPLATQELIELYYDFYNPDTATRQQLKNFDDIGVSVITKGDGQAPQPHLEKELK